MPASTGERPLMIWNRWGRLKIVIRKGKPAKRADLETNQNESPKNKGSYSRKCSRNNTVAYKSRGNTGNMAIFPARAVKRACQTVKATQEMPEITMAALFQGYWFPPLSRAKQSTTEATRESTTPGQSTCAISSREIFCWLMFRGKTNIIRAIIMEPPGILEVPLAAEHSLWMVILLL
jgi:hypothetical protein